MNICIIDDEKSNREILIYLIQQIDASISIVAEAENVRTGIEIINRCKPDLIFLDIEMPDGTGFDLIKKLTTHHPEIIFCTAYNQFALRAIECSALAYILKPITKSIVAEALHKAQNQIKTKNNALQYQVLQEQLNEENKSNARFLISNSDGMHIIYFNELICCTAHSNYTDIHIENKKKITVSKTLKEIEIMFGNHPQFIRIHQSSIININKITNILKSETTLALQMTNNMELNISRSKKEEVLNRINFTETSK